MTLTEYNYCVNEYSDGVFRFAYKSSGSKEEAKDIVQHCYAVLWEKKDGVEVAKARSFLFTIAYRKSMDVHRSRRPVQDLDHVQEAVKPSVHNRELKNSIEKALMEIDTEARSLVILKDVEGYSYDEISRMTGLSLSQVKVYLFRARKILQQKLAIYKYQM